MESRNKYDEGIINICKIIMRFLMLVLALCIILGSVDLVRVIWKELSTETDTPQWFLSIKTLLKTFNLILTVAVGFELVKALHTLIASKAIPSIPLIQIAIIALANKMITVDFKEAGYEKVLGMAAVMLSLATAYFFMKKGNMYMEKSEPHSDKKKDELSHK